MDWSKPHIFLMNHQSALDIPVAFAVLPALVLTVAGTNGKGSCAAMLDSLLREGGVLRIPDPRRAMIEDRHHPLAVARAERRADRDRPRPLHGPAQGGAERRLSGDRATPRARHRRTLRDRARHLRSRRRVGG